MLSDINWSQKDKYCVMLFRCVCMCVCVKVAQSCLTLLRPRGLYSPWNSPGKNTGVGSLSLLQGVFPTQESNLGLPHCRWILYHLSHEGNLDEVSKIVKPTETHRNRGLRGGGNEDCCSVGVTFQFCKVNKFWICCTTLCL